MSHAKIQVVEESRYSNCNWFARSWTFCVDSINIRSCSCGTITMKQTMDKTKTYSFGKLSLSPENNYSLQTRAIMPLLIFWIWSIKKKKKKNCSSRSNLVKIIFSALAFALKLFVQIRFHYFCLNIFPGTSVFAKMFLSVNQTEGMFYTVPITGGCFTIIRYVLVTHWT